MLGRIVSVIGGALIFAAGAYTLFLQVTSGEPYHGFIVGMGGVLLLLGVVCLYIAQLRRRALRWRGTTIQWREHGRDIRQEMAKFDGFRRALSGLFHLRFRDGTILKLDLYCQNAEDFAAAISEHVGRDIE